MPAIDDLATIIIAKLKTHPAIQDIALSDETGCVIYINYDGDLFILDLQVG